MNQKKKKDLPKKKFRILQKLLRIIYVCSFALVIVGLILIQYMGEGAAPILFVAILSWLLSGASMAAMNAFGILRFSLQLLFFTVIGTAFGISATMMLPGSWKVLGLVFLAALFFWIMNDVLRTNFKISEEKLEQELLASHEDLLKSIETDKKDGTRT